MTAEQRPGGTDPSRGSKDVYGAVAVKAAGDLRKAGKASGEDVDNSRGSRLKRLRQIVGVLRRYDLFRGVTPDKLCNMLQALGPTFVKAGQILSMRSEILPQSYCDALAKLRTHANPMPYQTVLDTLESEYSRPIDEVFSSIDRHPLGSASLAQVHHATLVTGEDVAVKVQRPGAREMMAQDIEIMRSVMKWASRLLGAWQVVDLQGVVEEIWASFRSETDFLEETRSLQEFREFTASYRYMDCPRVYPRWCTRRVVVMDYVRGIPLGHTGELEAEGYDLQEIGTKLVDNYSAQILDEGFFHADPHPGNIIVRDGKIVLIDLGMTGRLTSRMRSLLRGMIFALAKGDSVELENSLLSLARLKKSTGGVDRAALLNDINDIVDGFGTIDLAELDVGQFVMSLFQMVERNGLELPGSVTLVARALVTLEGTLTRFIPDVNMLEVIERHVKSSENIRDVARKETVSLTTEGLRATHGLFGSLADSKTAMRQLTRGQLKVNAELVHPQGAVQQLSYIVDRLTMAIIIAGLFVGSSIVYYARIQPVIFGIPVVGMMGYVVAFVLGVWIVIDILHKNHLLKKRAKRGR